MGRAERVARGHRLVCYRLPEQLLLVARRRRPPACVPRPREAAQDQEAGGGGCTLLPHLSDSPDFSCIAASYLLQRSAARH
eukprot:997136-Rhodomonas_salina.1